MVCVLWSYGGYCVGETPGPIPNPEAKPYCADGTALVTVWESRSLPYIFWGWPRTFGAGPFSFWGGAVPAGSAGRGG